MCETFLILLFKVGRRILNMAAPSSGGPGRECQRETALLFAPPPQRLDSESSARCCGHGYTSRLTSASSGFQGGLKTKSSPGILRAWRTRSGLLGHTASWSSCGVSASPACRRPLLDCITWVVSTAVGSTSLDVPSLT